LIAVVLLAVVATYCWSRLRAGSNAIQSTVLNVTSPDPEGLRVGAYNIAHGRGGELGATNRRADGKAGLIAHLEAIGRSIREEGLDIVVLNEVDFSTSWSWRVNQAEVIAKAAGLPHIIEQRSYDASLLFYKWEFGNAILSRFPISDAELVKNPAFKNYEAQFFGKKESCLGKISAPGLNLTIVGVHLEVRDEATRAESMALLAELEASRPDELFLMMGDFNSKVVFDGSERLLSTGGGEELTFPSSDPNRRIDWIFASPGLELKDGRVFGGHLSDHLGVSAEVTRRAAD